MPQGYSKALTVHTGNKKKVQGRYVQFSLTTLVVQVK